jgi:hypothetical protein
MRWCICYICALLILCVQWINVIFEVIRNRTFADQGPPPSVRCRHIQLLDISEQKCSDLQSEKLKTLWETEIATARMSEVRKRYIYHKIVVTGKQKAKFPVVEEKFSSHLTFWWHTGSMKPTQNKICASFNSLLPCTSPLLILDPASSQYHWKLSAYHTWLLNISSSWAHSCHILLWHVLKLFLHKC